MIISNSNYQLDWLDWIANMKKTFQFYKAKADSSTAINQQSLQTEDCTENTTYWQQLILYKAASRVDKGKGVKGSRPGC